MRQSGVMSSNHPLGQPIEFSPTYVGGLRLPNVFSNFGWPAARLVLLEEGVWIGPSAGVFRPLVPTRQFRFDEPCDIQAIGNSWMAYGIRFHSLATKDWVIFWTWRSRRQAILGELVPLTDCVNPEPVRLLAFNPLRQWSPRPNYFYPGPLPNVE
jgi:hypothetical protein